MDTNHWRYLFDGNSTVVNQIRRLAQDESLLMSVVTEAELLVSIERAASPRTLRTLTRYYQDALLLVVEILPITSEIAANFAKISAELRRKGRPIGVNDMWLAATAQAHELTLVTNDADFLVIDGIRLENWSGVAE